MNPPNLPGRRILVVEDEPIVAMMIEDVLVEAGCEVAGPASVVKEALKIVDSTKVDAAVLDVNLGDEDTYPIARVLRERSIPFVFSTGYGDSGIDAEFSGHKTLRKPFEEVALLASVSELLD